MLVSAQMATDLKPLIGLPLFTKPKRGGEPSLGRMQSFFLNMLRERDPEYRKMTEEIEGQARRMQDYLDTSRESLMATVLQMAVPSSARRRQLVSDGGHSFHEINERLPEGVRWQDAATWTIRAHGEQPADIAREAGWPVATVEEAIITYSRAIGYWKLLDKEGRLR